MEVGAWELPPELLTLQRKARDFMRSEVAPVEAILDHDAYAVPRDVLADLQRKARSLGLWCIRSPAEHGGAGLSALGQTVVAEESAQCRMGLSVPACGAFGNDPPNAIFQGTPEQIRKFGVPAIADGERVFVAMTEAGGGSDPARTIQMRAVKRGDRYILNGTKLWVTGGEAARWGIVFARTGDPKERGGITCFIVDKSIKGVTLREQGTMRSFPVYEMEFHDAELPEDYRLGAEGEGFSLGDRWLTVGRIPYSAACIGVARAALDMAVAWAQRRETFKSKLAEKQAIQWMVADSEVEIRAARLLVYQAAWKADLKQEIKVDTAIAKLVSTETAFRVVDRCMQILGSWGVSDELPIERWFRELRIRRISDGPAEVQRMVIARDIFGRAAGAAEQIRFPEQMVRP